MFYENFICILYFAICLLPEIPAKLYMNCNRIMQLYESEFFILHSRMKI